MSNVAFKDQAAIVPERNRKIVARPRPALGKTTNHEDQVKKAFELCFENNKKGLEYLSKI